MLYCEKCGVHLSGPMNRCPLCQGRLSGEAEGDAPFPLLPAEGQPYWLAVRLAALATIAVLAVCAAINFSIPESGWWSVFVAAGLASMWLLVWVAVRKRSNPIKSFIWQLGAVSALVLLWDWCTGFAGWSINFVLPVLIPCMQLAMAAMARAFRLRPSDYLLPLTICTLAGLALLIPLLRGTLRVIYPAVICVGVSVISLAALLLFCGAALKDEIARRTHL